MRRFACFLGSLLLLACGREPGAPVEIGRPEFLVQPTGTYDIYVYGVKSQSAVQATALFGALEFNPAFSPDGKSLVHDVLTFDPFTHNLYVTDIDSRASAPLVGGEGGNDGDWSPSGRFIAFDRIPAGDPNVYVVPASGGVRRLVRANAADPQLGPDGNHLVVSDVTDGSVRTIDIRSGADHVVASFGFNPAWSKDGRRIAYTDGNSIFFVPVDPAGTPSGPSVQLTFDDPSAFNQQPSWSNDGMSIVFHSNRGNTNFDWDLWVVSVSAGAPTRLTGTVGIGDFDPSFYLGKLVAFAGFTPPGP